MDRPVADLSRRQWLASTAAFFAGTACTRSQAGFGGHAFVASQDSRSIAVVQFSPFKVVKQLKVATGPTALITHPSRALVYALTPDDGTVYEIDAANPAIKRKLTLGATAIEIAPDGATLWAACRAPNQLVGVAVDSFSAQDRIGLAREPLALDLSQYSNLAVVSDPRAGTVQMIDLKKRAGLPEIHVAPDISFALFRSDGNALMIGNRAEKRLAILEAPSGQTIAHLPLSVRPDNVCVSRDGGQLYITGEGMDAVVVVYPHHVPQVAETALAGRRPGAMSTSERYLFVTSPSSGDLIIMNAETRRVIAVTPVGVEPSFVAVTPNDSYALILNRQSGDMAVLRIGAIQPNRNKSVALLTMVPVGSKPVSAVTVNA